MPLRILPILAAASTLATGAVLAADAPPGPKEHGGLCEKISCTTAQKQQVHDLMRELREDTKGDREAIRTLHGKLAAEFAEPKPSDKDIDAIQLELARHEAAIGDRVQDAMMELHGVLDAKQRAEVARMIEHRGLRGLMKGPGRHGKPGKPGKSGKGKGKGKGKG
jgi:Spy/CpxP family protein refolding chaperone